MFEPTLSIDLGASYTKVAYRRACYPKRFGPHDEEAKILMVDRSPLIPSLAIRTDSKSRPWVFGQEAANLNPGKGMKVFLNWKAGLFRPSNDKSSAEAVIVAEHFLGWLKDKIEEAGVDLKETHTRIAMPAFRTFDEQALVVARCMELNGWESPMILKATEPHANTLGLFSEGRNMASRNRVGNVFLNYGGMFGESNVLVQTTRKFVLFNTGSNIVKGAVVDIGAFTTDIAALTFDITAPENDFSDGLAAIREQSHAIGVRNDLDVPLFAELSADHGFDVSSLSFKEAELAKLALYHGKQYSLLVKSVGEVRIGDEKDLLIVEKHAAKFAASLWKAVLPFIQRERPAVVYFTGGGSLIPVVIKGLEEKFRENRISIAKVPEGDAAGTNAQWCKWANTGEGLNRLATAVGGASVVLQSAEAKHDGEGRPKEQKPPTRTLDPRYISCRCQGGNKDCCFCDGRGYYSRR